MNALGLRLRDSVGANRQACGENSTCTIRKLKYQSLTYSHLGMGELVNHCDPRALLK